ncbi:MAG: DUF4339 domain-containing protein [Verrucomicrobiales bacterium]|nr:DUF4339 domain-containing protein [Verrucomicrobiales bacterium]
MPDTEWFYAPKGKKLGPIPVEDLKNLALSGDLQPETLVWSEGMAEWKRHDAVFPEVWKTLDRAGSLGGPSGIPATAGIPPVHPDRRCARCGRPLPVDDLVPIVSQRICLQCKSVVLQGLQEDPRGKATGTDPEIEAVRREHIAQETSLRSIGILCGLNAILLPLVLLGTLADALAAPGRIPRTAVLQWCLMVAYYPLLLYVTAGLLRLSPKVRTPAITLFALSSFVPPICFIHWLFLYTMLSRKTRRVLSEDYQAIIRATPLMRYRPPLLRTVLVTLLVLGIGAFFGMLVLRGMAMVSASRAQLP